MLDRAAFLTLYPEFSDVEGTVLDRYLAEAARTTDARYEGDEDNAHGLLTGHLLSINGHGPERAAMAFVGAKSITSGSLSISRDEKMGDYGLTSYGRSFWPISRTVGGMFVTGTGTVPDTLETFLHGSDATP